MSEEPGIGHNSADGQLRAYFQRIQNVRAEMADLKEDEREIFKEMKGNGYDPKIVKKLLRELERDQTEIDEEEALLETYRRALGDYASTPLGDAAMQRAGASV